MISSLHKTFILVRKYAHQIFNWQLNEDQGEAWKYLYEAHYKIMVEWILLSGWWV
jgi:hypothetical protein